MALKIDLGSSFCCQFALVRTAFIMHQSDYEGKNFLS